MLTCCSALLEHAHHQLVGSSMSANSQHDLFLLSTTTMLISLLFSSTLCRRCSPVICAKCIMKHPLICHQLQHDCILIGNLATTMYDRS